jgi:hypothetical protein
VNTGNEMDEGDLPIVTRYYLFLSGTPFRALNSGEFIEEQIFNWTYSDEQKAKEDWPSEHPGVPNPYESLPRMVMLTYQMPDEIRKVALGGEYNSFDLNAFFEAKPGRSSCSRSPSRSGLTSYAAHTGPRPWTT